MDNNFLATIQHEDQSVVLAEEEKETPAPSPEENKPEDAPAPPAEEEKKDAEPPKESEEAVFHAFHEHPRWKAREEELKELRAFRERVEPLLPKIENLGEEKKSEIPEWFSTLFGESGELWEKYQSHSQAERKQIETELTKKFQPFIDTAQKIQEKEELDGWASKEWKALEVDAKVQSELKALGRTLDRKTQEEIAQVLDEYMPSDEKGNLSLKKGFELWKALKARKIEPSAQTEEKKRIASRTIEKPGGSETKRDYRTSEDFKGKTFADLIRDVE